MRLSIIPLIIMAFLLLCIAEMVEPTGTKGKEPILDGQKEGHLFIRFSDKVHGIITIGNYEYDYLFFGPPRRRIAISQNAEMPTYPAEWRKSPMKNASGKQVHLVERADEIFYEMATNGGWTKEAYSRDKMRVCRVFIYEFICQLYGGQCPPEKDWPDHFLYIDANTRHGMCSVFGNNYVDKIRPTLVVKKEDPHCRLENIELELHFDEESEKGKGMGKRKRLEIDGKKDKGGEEKKQKGGVKEGANHKEKEVASAGDAIDAKEGQRIIEQVVGGRPPIVQIITGKIDPLTSGITKFFFDKFEEDSFLDDAFTLVEQSIQQHDRNKYKVPLKIYACTDQEDNSRHYYFKDLAIMDNSAHWKLHEIPRGDLLKGDTNNLIIKLASSDTAISIKKPEAMVHHGIFD